MPTPITTTTTTVTTTTEVTTTVTVVTVENKIIYFPFACSFDGKKFNVSATTANVKKVRGGWEVAVARGDTTVIRIAEPTHDGVAATFSVRSNSEGPEWVDWTHGTPGFESPYFPNAGTITIEITATIAGGTSGSGGGATGVSAADSLTSGEQTAKRTTLIVNIKKPGMPDLPMEEEE